MSHRLSPTARYNVLGAATRVQDYRQRRTAQNSAPEAGHMRAPAGGVGPHLGSLASKNARNLMSVLGSWVKAGVW
jgi:hypothetical protein